MLRALSPGMASSCCAECFRKRRWRHAARPSSASLGHWARADGSPGRGAKKTMARIRNGPKARRTPVAGTSHGLCGIGIVVRLLPSSPRWWSPGLAVVENLRHQRYCRLAPCLARHAIDVDLGVGAHQDAKGLPPMVPFSVWVPMHDVSPRSNSGLGFVVRPPDSVLPTLPHGDVGPDYVLGNIDRVWVPTYRAGDVTIHTNFMPHFTTGDGTRSDRYSLEVRAMAREAAPWTFHNPCVYVGRRDGVPAIAGMHCELPVRANHFLALFRSA